MGVLCSALTHKAPAEGALCFVIGAQKKTRTSTPLRALAPEASVSTNSTTWALKAMHLHSFHGTTSST